MVGPTDKILLKKTLRNLREKAGKQQGPTKKQNFYNRIRT